MANYIVEFHRVWVKTVEANSRSEARQMAEDEMSEESDAEDYNYSVVKQEPKPAPVAEERGSDEHEYYDGR